MTRADGLLELALLERRKYNYLSEVLDLTQQIGEALDRNDQVSLRMLVAMRQEPLLHLEEVAQSIRSRREELPPEDRERVARLLAGAAPGNSEETTFAEEAGRARRLLERTIELDRRISLRLGGKDSFYKN